MKRNVLLILCIFSVTSFTNVDAQNATIKVDILRQVGQIDRNIYGVFMEPIGWKYAVFIWVYALAWFVLSALLRSA